MTKQEMEMFADRLNEEGFYTSFCNYDKSQSFSAEAIIDVCGKNEKISVYLSNYEDKNKEISAREVYDALDTEFSKIKDTLLKDSISSGLKELCRKTYFADREVPFGEFLIEVNKLKEHEALVNEAIEKINDSQTRLDKIFEVKAEKTKEKKEHAE